MRTLTFLLTLSFSLSVQAETAKSGKSYIKAMKASVRAVLKAHQKLINEVDGKVKDKKLLPEAIYRKTYETFSELAGEEFSTKNLGKDPQKIAHALGTFLQAGRINIAKLQKKINREKKGKKKLKKFIPAVFGRLVAEEFAKRTGVQIKQTTLGKGKHGARNPYNVPDAWEKKALVAIAKPDWKRNLGFGEESPEGYRLIKPIYIKKACLGCHGKGGKGPYGHFREGYKVNELRGGISILIPKGK